MLVEHALEYAAHEAEAERLKTKSKIKAQRTETRVERRTFEMTKQAHASRQKNCQVKLTVFPRTERRRNGTKKKRKRTKRDSKKEREREM